MTAAPLDALLSAALVEPGAGTGELPRPAVARAVACADDLVFEQRVAVRAFVSGGGAEPWRVDLRDSQAAPSTGPSPRISADDVRLAAILAFSDVLALAAPDRRLAAHIELLLEPTSWVGAPTPCPDVALRLFAIARTYDAICGALALAWPERGRAGSCSLGAIVELRTADGALLDVVAGGRGADAHGPGQSAWPGPLLPAGALARDAALTVETTARPGSGGVGARNGGDGCIARYRCARPAQLRVALDRLSNPPHGLDRAGPPEPAALHRITAAGERIALAPWRVHTLSPGETLEVMTAGGAGHGFPGWGIEFDWS